MDATGFLVVVKRKGEMISKKKLICLIIFISLWVSISHCFGGWLIYHKPEFKGKVIDAESKAPIEGAVAVVVYNKHSLISGPGGGYSSVIKVKEMLTDNNGEFHFPAYTTLIQPNSVEDFAEFIIYKPGYGNFPNQQTIPRGLGAESEELFFSKGIGNTGELEALVHGEIKMIKITFGIVELPMIKSVEEWLKSQPSTPTDFGAKELPLLYQAINEERKRHGLGEVK